MIKLRNRVRKGVPTAGQFATEQRSEPDVTLVSDPQAVANLNRPFPNLEGEDLSSLRQHKPYLSEARSASLRSQFLKPAPAPEEPTGLVRPQTPLLSKPRSEALNRLVTGAWK